VTRIVAAFTMLVALLVVATATATGSTVSQAPRLSACPPGEEQSPVRVLVAARLIPRGTPGVEIAGRQMYKPFTLPCGEREPGAIGDPADLTGRVAAHDIFPGQQLTTFDFTGVRKVSLTTPVRAGSYAALTIAVTPRSRCTIQVIHDTVVSKAKGLGPKTGGKITWRWRVGTSTHPGKWPIVVNCGASGKLKTAIRVLPR
jgi:hypothetical protein